MEQLLVTAQQIFGTGIRLFEDTSRVPYFPDGRDNTERDFKLMLHEISEAAFQFQAVSCYPFTMLNWICIVIAFISLILFIRTIYFIKMYDRHRGYSTHLPNTVVMIFLHLAYLFDYALHFYTSAYSSQLKHNNPIFFTSVLLFLCFLGISALHVYICHLLKYHQQVLNTIKPLPYKPKGA